MRFVVFCRLRMTCGGLSVCSAIGAHRRKSVPLSRRCWRSCTPRPPASRLSRMTCWRSRKRASPQKSCWVPGCAGGAARPPRPSASAGGDHVERHLVELVGGVAARQRSSGEGQFAWRGDQHDLSFQLAMELVQIGRGVEMGAKHRFAVTGPSVAHGPRHRIAISVSVGGFHHAGRVKEFAFPDLLPIERAPLFQIGANCFQSPILKLRTPNRRRRGKLRRIWSGRATVAVAVRL